MRLKSFINFPGQFIILSFFFLSWFCTGIISLVFTFLASEYWLGILAFLVAESVAAAPLALTFFWIEFVTIYDDRIEYRTITRKKCVIPRDNIKIRREGVRAGIASYSAFIIKCFESHAEGTIYMRQLTIKYTDDRFYFLKAYIPSFNLD